MTQDATQADPNVKPAHTPSDFGGHKRNLDGTIEDWKYEEPEPPSLTERAHALVASLEHAIKHNSPVTQAMIAEARELMGVPVTHAELPADTKPDA